MIRRRDRKDYKRIGTGEGIKTRNPQHRSIRKGDMKMNKTGVIAIIVLIAFIIGGIFLTNAIIQSDLPDWWKFILLK